MIQSAHTPVSVAVFLQDTLLGQRWFLAFGESVAHKTGNGYCLALVCLFARTTHRRHTQKRHTVWYVFFVVGRGGFEPPKSKTSDLQSDPFGRSGICPYMLGAFFSCGAGDWTRTHNLLITNQLLCQLSYTGICGAFLPWGRYLAFGKSVVAPTGLQKKYVCVCGRSLAKPNSKLNA